MLIAPPHSVTPSQPLIGELMPGELPPLALKSRQNEPAPPFYFRWRKLTSAGGDTQAPAPLLSEMLPLLLAQSLPVGSLRPIKMPQPLALSLLLISSPATE